MEKRFVPSRELAKIYLGDKSLSEETKRLNDEGFRISDIPPEDVLLDKLREVLAEEIEKLLTSLAKRGRRKGIKKNCISCNNQFAEDVKLILTKWLGLESHKEQDLFFERLHNELTEFLSENSLKGHYGEVFAENRKVIIRIK